MATLTHRNVSSASSIAGGCLSNYFTVKLAAQKSVQISCADSDASTAKEMASDMQWFNNFGGMQVAFVYALLLHMRVVLLNASETSNARATRLFLTTPNSFSAFAPICSNGHLVILCP